LPYLAGKSVVVTCFLADGGAALGADLGVISSFLKSAFVMVDILTKEIICVPENDTGIPRNYQRSLHNTFSHKFIINTNILRYIYWWAIG